MIECNILKENIEFDLNLLNLVNVVSIMSLSLLKHRPGNLLIINGFGGLIIQFDIIKFFEIDLFHIIFLYS